MTGAEKWFRRMVVGVLVFVVLLVFVGAIVRATGAGLGCPDWPKCWGEMIPPWKVEQVDLEKIDYERFRKKAERLGRDPEMVTPERILESFNPVHTWTEFVNRLVSLPVGAFSLGAVVFSFFLKRPDKWVFVGLSVLSLAIVLVNAVMGAMVVYSGLKPGIITLHLALAMLLIYVLVYCRWRVSGAPKMVVSSAMKWTVFGLLFLSLAEGIMGAQVRELTDELAKSHQGEARADWIYELEESGLYLLHRSFSWFIVIATGLAFFFARKGGLNDRRMWALLGLVGSLMLMGLIMAHIAVFPWIQVLHVGAAALLVTLLCDWVLVLRTSKV